MSRETEKLYHGITGIREDLIEEAEVVPARTRIYSWKKRAAAAACAVLAVTAGGMVIYKNGLGGASTGANGHAEGSSFMSYAGPVLPLAVLTGGEGLTAERKLTFDFARPGEAGSEESWKYNESACNTEDAYVITNQTNEEKKVVFSYASPGDLRDLANRLPMVTINGKSAELSFYAGSYSGGYTTDNLNMDELTSWEQYESLLGDGSYRNQALAEFPDLSRKVIVYEFNNEKGDIEAWPAATMEAEFQVDTDKTRILTYGFNGARWNLEEGKRGCSYFIPDKDAVDYDCSHYLIVEGEDIGEITLQGYQNGGCDAGTELAITAEMERYETTLGDVLQMTMKDFRQQYIPQDQRNMILMALSDDELTGLAAELLLKYGLLTKETFGRYEGGMLEDIYGDTFVQKRIFYQTFTAVIPAGESIEICAEMFKEPSFDFFCSGSKNTGIDGYDLAAHLGSSLEFSKQTVSIENTDEIEIVRQNLGFDLKQGITSVVLDPEQDHYYLEIRHIERNK